MGFQHHFLQQYISTLKLVQTKLECNFLYEPFIKIPLTMNALLNFSDLSHFLCIASGDFACCIFKSTKQKGSTNPLMSKETQTNRVRLELLSVKDAFAAENTTGEALLTVTILKEKKKLKLQRKPPYFMPAPNNKFEIGKITIGDNALSFQFTDSEKKQTVKHYTATLPLNELLPYSSNHVKEIEFENETNKDDQIKPKFTFSMFLFLERDTKAEKQILKHQDALYIATDKSDLMLIMAALEAPKVNVNFQDPQTKNTALHLATDKSANEHIILTLLKDERVNVNILNTDDNTPLHLFCKNFSNPSCEEAFNLFMKRSADINKRNKIGETPLHKAVFNTCVRMFLVEMLLKEGADVDAKTENGNTAMHYAVYMERTDLISILLENNASLTVMNNKKETPLSIVMHSKNTNFKNSVLYFKDLCEYLKTINVDQNETKIFIHNRLFKWKLRELTAKQMEKLGITAIGRQRELLQIFSKLTDVDPVKALDKSNQNESEEVERKKLLETIEHSQKFVYKVEYTELIGTGTSGKVFKGILGEKIVVAVKTLKAGSLKEVEEFQHEFGVISKLKNENIVNFYGVFQNEEQKMMMVMEYCDKGSLYDVLSKSEQRITWKTMIDFSTQITLGLEYLHKLHILHRDLKSLNILVQSGKDERDILKICDFGLSRFDDTANLNTLQKLRGTYAYCAPEIYFSQPFTEKSDVYSLGIIIWEMTYRTVYQKYMRPYQEFSDIKLDVQIILKSATMGVRPTIPPSTPILLVSLIKHCVIKEQDGRPSASEVFKRLEEMKAEYESNPSLWDTCVVSNEK
ncbi:hypothetical protein EIN_175780 [Entamoeba invadens IP1]|uniref:hypothetical protein n=1 Tax=Entamoeba invadens IP1 TaxID=370355 RepID=UPI0002C3E4F8|nr:hypothetical protein EIN_175780 [Entamoeba invadens IP1]ELP93791.1 hypothetical protein EIN_175780 [Entamoeba invadens IP1]|eukprot:XP_004260562.1 hypothetical protein EIN_175780 [Entamoeba invadens IP1]